MSNEIYKIVKIISDRAVVINAGKNEAVKFNDMFEIFQPGVDVFDPETNEPLGTLDYIKATISVITVLPKMSVCKSATEEETFTLFPIPSLSLPKQKVVANTLNIDPEDISGGFEHIEKKIKVGDLVRKV